MHQKRSQSMGTQKMGDRTRHDIPSRNGTLNRKIMEKAGTGPPYRNLYTKGNPTEHNRHLGTPMHKTDTLWPDQIVKFTSIACTHAYTHTHMHKTRRACYAYFGLVSLESHLTFHPLYTQKHVHHTHINKTKACTHANDHYAHWPGQPRVPPENSSAIDRQTFRHNTYAQG